MSKGIDVHINKLVAKFTSDLWTTKTNDFNGRIFRNEREVNGETVVDYTQLKSTPRTKNIYGARVKSLSSIKKSTQRLVKKESAKYRREKDIDTLDRIKEVERIERMF